MADRESFDYVVVGAGSAGCVLANRLSADPAVRVALVEAGRPDRRLEISVPAGFSKLFHSDYDWDLRTVAQPELKARELYWPRGKVLGGSSSLNAQMWVRGARADYDGWGERAPGWSYDEVLPYFRRAENRVGSNAGGAYGVGGPLYIEELRDPNPLRPAFFEACAQLGLDRLPELNEPGIDGYAPTPVNQHRGRRWSAADGYLRPARRRPNLTVFTSTDVARIVLDGGRASGVLVRSGSGPLRELRAQAEVILSAGAVHSPHLLQHSGIGDPDVLARAGIEFVVDSPEVGQGLQDHLACGVMKFTRDPVSLVGAESPREYAKYFATRTGKLSSNVAEAVAFVRSDPELAVPDLELLFAPVPFIDHGLSEPPGHGMTIAVILLQPESSGTVYPRTADPRTRPAIDAGYLREPADLRRLLRGMDLVGELFESSALRPLLSGPMLPGPQDTDLAEFVRQRAETLYHPTGTCRMGADAGSVVDPELRVRGVEGLRVVDASVMPQIIRGHTHAPTVMIAERAADLIRNS